MSFNRRQGIEKTKPKIYSKVLERQKVINMLLDRIVITH